MGDNPNQAAEPHTLGVVLTVAQWHVVLEALQPLPFRVAAPVVAQIQEQARARLSAPGG